MIDQANISPFYQGVIATSIAIFIVTIGFKSLSDYSPGQLLGINPHPTKSRFQQTRRRIWLRKGVLMGYGAIFVVILLGMLEVAGVIDLVPSSGENQLTQVAPVFGAFGSIALTFGLLILYDKQARVLTQQYQPYLTVDLENRSAVTTQLVVRNTGEDYAYDISAEWEVGGESREWESANLAPGDSAAFPVVVDDDGRWLFSTQLIEDHLDESGGSSEIDFSITCTDQMGLTHSFNGTVDFDVMSKRQDAKEIWETDQMASLVTSAESIEASIDQIASDFGNRRDEHEWQDRWAKQQAIKTIVAETEEIPISVLARIVKEREGSLEYRLTELESAGYLDYNEKSGKIHHRPSAGDNHTLSDFP